MKKLLSSMSILFVLLFLGCRGGYVQNIQTTLPLKDKTTMKERILNAGESLGWYMKEIDDNTILARLMVRHHSATVKITYTGNSYNITYLRSRNLNYNAQNNAIHNQYNSWVQNLAKNIDSLTFHKDIPNIDLMMTNTLKEELKKSSQDKITYQNEKDVDAMGKLIYDVQNQPINDGFTLDKIEDAIIKGGKSLGWKIQKIENGQMLGYLSVRKHSATVMITYNQHNYSITYITSQNLNYDKYRIHNNYNGWIKYLEKSIDNRLTPLTL